MATAIGVRKRGRKKEDLRLWATANVVEAGPFSDDDDAMVQYKANVALDGGKDMLTFTAPKGAAIVPLDLTASKAAGNAREQIRLGIADAEVSGSIRSVAFKNDAGEEGTLFLVYGPVPAPKPRRSRTPKAATK